MSSFKENAAKELLTVLPSEREEELAFLCAVTKQAGYLHITGKRKNLVFALSSYEECLAVTGMLKDFYPTEFEIAVEHIKSGVKKGGTAYSVAVPTGFARQAIDDLHAMEAGVPSFVRTNRTLAVAYLKGLMMACGSVYAPSVENAGEKREGYHFEFAVSDAEYAEEIVALLSDLGIKAKTSERGAAHLVYIKDKDEILGMLAVLGLAESVLKLKAVIDERETANSINRVTICEAANLDKTYAAAMKQLMAIGAIEESEGLSALAPALRDTACARMEYPQASMTELADILGVSKSCLNHRLRKLVEIARENGFGD